MTILWVLWFPSFFFHFLMSVIQAWCGVVQGSKHSAVDLCVTAEDLLSSLMLSICIACSCSIQVFQSWYLHNFIVLHWSWQSFQWQNQIQITVVFIICLSFICVCPIYCCSFFCVVFCLLYFMSSCVIFVCCMSCSLPFRFRWLLKIFINHPLHKSLQHTPGCLVHYLHQKCESWSFIFQPQVNFFWGSTYLASTLHWLIPQFF